MEFSVILDIIFALGAVYLLLSLISSAFLEMWAGNRRLRTRFLNKAITGMFSENEEALTQFYGHPLIKSLVENPSSDEPLKQKPAYIPSDIFAAVMLEMTSTLSKIAPTPAQLAADAAAALANPAPAADVSLDKLRTNAGGLVAVDLGKALTSLVGPIGADSLDTARKNVANWFDATMERTNGWYKRYSQKRLLGIAFVLAFALNVDTLDLVAALYDKPELLEKTVQATATFLASPDIKRVMENPADTKPEEERKGEAGEERDKALLSAVTDLNEALNTADLPWGWQAAGIRNLFTNNDYGFIAWRVIVKFAGLLFTGISVSFGAPFWFDLLNKVSNVRAAGQVPLTATEKKPQTVEE